MMNLCKVLSDILTGLQFEYNQQTHKNELICNKNHNYIEMFPTSISVHDSFLIGFGGLGNQCMYILSTPNIGDPDKNYSFKSIASESLDAKYITIMNVTHPLVQTEEEYFQRSLIEDMTLPFEDMVIFYELKQYVKEALNL